MVQLRHIDRLPVNFAEYIGEIAAGVAALYGEKAGEHHRKSSRASFQATIAHHAVEAIALCDGHTAAGLLLAAARGRISPIGKAAQVGQISFIHVLRRYGGQGVEQQLVTEAVRGFRANGAEGIVAECVAFCPLRLEGTYRALGFEKVERLLMAAPLSLPTLACVGPPTSRPYEEEQWVDIAETIVDAYRDHPGRKLHVEVRDPLHALAFLKSVSSGGYGLAQPGYGRAIRRNGRCAGAIVGCEVAPDVGFVLQVAVRPPFQRQGIGTQLLRDLAYEYRKAGLSRMALGVTRTNPAKRLYDRLGFGSLRPVNAYVWWRP